MNVLLLMDYDLPDDDPNILNKLVEALASTEYPFMPETVHLTVKEKREELLALLEEEEVDGRG